MSAAAAAAAAARRRARREEESMTGYTPSDLADGWEFKILRSATSAFRDPARMREALEQESRAGWTLVEKFDNQRLRLKRPATARAGDSGLDFDPYRTTFGISETKLGISIAGSILVFLGVVVLIIVLLKSGHP
jgi:hypothetical protein